MLLQLCHQKIHLLRHLLVLIGDLLGVLRLILQLTGQLHILLDRQLGRALQLVLIHGQHLRLDIPDVRQHLLAQLVNGDVPFLLYRLQLLSVLILIVIQLLFQLFLLVDLVCLLLLPVFDVHQLFLLQGDLLVLVFNIRDVLGAQHLVLILMVFVHAFDYSPLVLRVLDQLFDLVADLVDEGHLEFDIFIVLGMALVPLILQRLDFALELLVVSHQNLGSVLNLHYRNLRISRFTFNFRMRSIEATRTGIRWRRMTYSNSRWSVVKLLMSIFFLASSSWPGTATSLNSELAMVWFIDETGLISSCSIILKILYYF